MEVIVVVRIRGLGFSYVMLLSLCSQLMLVVAWRNVSYERRVADSCNPENYMSILKPEPMVQKRCIPISLVPFNLIGCSERGRYFVTSLVLKRRRFSVGKD